MSYLSFSSKNKKNSDLLVKSILKKKPSQYDLFLEICKNNNALLRTILEGSEPIISNESQDISTTETNNLVETRKYSTNTIDCAFSSNNPDPRHEEKEKDKISCNQKSVPNFQNELIAKMNSTIEWNIETEVRDESVQKLHLDHEEKKNDANIPIKIKIRIGQIWKKCFDYVKEKGFNLLITPEMKEIIKQEAINQFEEAVNSVLDSVGKQNLIADSDSKEEVKKTKERRIDSINGSIMNEMKKLPKRIINIVEKRANIENNEVCRLAVLNKSFEILLDILKINRRNNINFVHFLVITNTLSFIRSIFVFGSIKQIYHLDVKNQERWIIEFNKLYIYNSMFTHITDHCKSNDFNLKDNSKKTLKHLLDKLSQKLPDVNTQIKSDVEENSIEKEQTKNGATIKKRERKQEQKLKLKLNDSLD